MAETRLHAIDHLKAWAIVAVVFTHAYGPGSFELPPGPSWRAVLCHLWTAFHVPSFLFASGLLYAVSARGEAVGLRTLASRLSRVLVPYAIASLVVHVLALEGAPQLGRFLQQLATGSALAIYYYVFLISVCIALVWPLSRLPRNLVVAAWAACVALEIAYIFEPSLRLSGVRWKWTLRDPLENFSLGFFLSGWLVAGRLEELARLRERHAARLAALCAAGIVLGLVYNLSFRSLALGSLPRMFYTFSVIGAVALAARTRPAGPAVRFLSEAGLGLYLYHAIPQIFGHRITRAWGEPWHILAEVALGLGAASLWLLAGRRLLGAERARRYLGA